MATNPTELPPFPSNPGENDPTPTELPPEMPDVDYPDSSPVYEPGFDPGTQINDRPKTTGMTGDFA